MTSEADRGPDREGSPGGRDAPGGPPGIDFHNHVLPGVDDGAADLQQALAGLRAFLAEGVGTVVATPHFSASLFERQGAAGDRLARFEEALAVLDDAVALQGLPVRLERGAEVRLDAPRPHLDDERVRLAGTRFVLVEFSHFQIPPFGGRQLAVVLDAGWIPVLAHPERYLGAERALESLGEWREAGTRLQVNAGSLVGQYGETASKLARELLSRGWADYLASDYHCRGEPGLAAARGALLRARIGDEDAGAPPPEGEAPGTGREGEGADGAREAASPAVRNAVRLLTRENPRRLLAGEDPLPVPPLRFGGGVWERVRSFLASSP